MMRRLTYGRLAMLVVGLGVAGWRMTGGTLPGGGHDQETAAATSVAAELGRVTSELRGSGRSDGPEIHSVAQPAPARSQQAPPPVRVVRGR